MKVTVSGEKRYGMDEKRFTFETYQDILTISYDGSTSTSESYEDHTREIEVNADEFKRSVRLIAEVPSLEAKIRIERDSWNTYTEGEVGIRFYEGNISLEFEQDEYLFDEDELVALIGAIVKGGK